MKKNLVTLLAIAFVVAIVSTGIFYGLFVGKLRTTPYTASGPRIVVAARTLSKGSTIQAADVKAVAWGAAETPKGAYASVEQVAGLTVVEPILEKEPVLEARVASPKSGAGAGMGIPAGMRAVSAQILDSAGVVAMLQPGRRVDVQLVSPSGAPPELKTIIQNVEVLRVDPPAEGRMNPVVTLLTRPEEADAIGLGDSNARLRLVLRNPLDSAQPALPRQTLPPLFQKTAPARP